jgi:hypothetical protein
MNRIALFSVHVLALAGCASARPPTLEVDGYVRIPIPAGCYGSGGARDHNVLLSPELHGELIRLLRDPPIDVMCWHERPDGTLLVTIGSECGPHREAEFQRLAATWVLKGEQNIVSECFIRCSEQDPKYCAI